MVAGSWAAALGKKGGSVNLCDCLLLAPYFLSLILPDMAENVDVHDL